MKLALQDEKYNHIEKGEMQNVREALRTKRDWMTTSMQTLSQLNKCTNPPIKCAQIRKEKAVRTNDLLSLRGGGGAQ